MSKLTYRCYLETMKFYFTRMRYWILLVCFTLAQAEHGHAGEVLHSHVDYEAGHYLVRLEMRIEAELETVYAFLTDFDNLIFLNDSIKTSRLLNTKGKQHHVLIEVEGCVWIYCKRVKQVQRVTEMGKGYIRAVTLPDKSDMEYGRVLWHIQQEGDFTIIQYRADYVPAFFIPPLVGPYIMKGRLLEEGEKTIQGIERLAQDEEEY